MGVRVHGEARTCNAARRLGPRFYDWQLVQSTDESWRECHLHARNLLGMHDYAQLLAELIERRAAGRAGAAFRLPPSRTTNPSCG